MHSTFIHLAHKVSGQILCVTPDFCISEYSLQSLLICFAHKSNTTSKMIKFSLNKSTTKPNKGDEDLRRLFELLQKTGVPVEDTQEAMQKDKENLEKENPEAAPDKTKTPECTNFRKCSGCHETKPVTEFPMSVRGSKQCRFCSKLKKSDLDMEKVSCEGSLAMKEPPRVDITSDDNKLKGKSPSKKSIIGSSSRSSSPSLAAKEENPKLEFKVAETACFA